ncbi:MAG TPA: hypothetical protein VM783_17570 [Candidatus Acidoferrum sp.]|nr:hypothetical protein [Candidatus Acidoferrum sp.]
MSLRYFKFEAEGDVVYAQGPDENSAYQVLTSKIGPVPRKELTITEVQKSDIPEGTDIL